MFKKHTYEISWELLKLGVHELIRSKINNLEVVVQENMEPEVIESNLREYNETKKMISNLIDIKEYDNKVNEILGGKIKRWENK